MVSKTSDSISRIAGRRDTNIAGSNCNLTPKHGVNHSACLAHAMQTIKDSLREEPSHQNRTSDHLRTPSNAELLPKLQLNAWCQSALCCLGNPRNSRSFERIQSRHHSRFLCLDCSLFPILILTSRALIQRDTLHRTRRLSCCNVSRWRARWWDSPFLTGIDFRSAFWGLVYRRWDMLCLICCFIFSMLSCMACWDGGLLTRWGRRIRLHWIALPISTLRWVTLMWVIPVLWAWHILLPLS